MNKPRKIRSKEELDKHMHVHKKVWSVQLNRFVKGHKRRRRREL